MWPSALSDFYTSIDKQLSREMENDKFSKGNVYTCGCVPIETDQRVLSYSLVLLN